MKTITFKDRVKIYVRSGNGGNGCSSFRREKFVPKGGPDGGDGGNGGHITLVADTNANSLLDLYYRPHQRAEHGVAGMGRQCHGRNGKSLEIKVPCGTSVVDDATGESLGEVVEEGATLRVAEGGKGGMGNMHFATSSHQAPTETTPGTPGEEKALWLELKLVADVGLVGYPNAGKSTLISKLSQAHPKVAPYPFTTLNPIIGILEFEDYQVLRIADIPGLIDGAHEGIGLGHDFLRHVERCSFFLFVIDMAGVDGRDPTEDYLNLRKELKLYREDLEQRPFLVVSNKMDLDASAENLEVFKEKTGIEPMEIVAETREGVDALKDHLHEILLTSTEDGT